MGVAVDDRFEIEARGRTDVGMKRRINEDVFVLDPEHGIYLVADGMGGHAAGEVASRVAAEEIMRIFQEGLSGEETTWSEHWDPSRSATANRLVDAVVAGHHRVTDVMNGDLELRGMGTTVVVAVHRPGERRLVLCHVGDSRAYRLRSGELQLLTSDHSWVHEQVEAGFLTEEAARTHPLKNVVTRALGGGTHVAVDLIEIPVGAGDRFLLCSDGLTGMVSDEEITNALSSPRTLEQIVRGLVDLANERGGVDNITAIMVEVRSADAPAPSGGPSGGEHEKTTVSLRTEPKPEDDITPTGGMEIPDLTGHPTPPSLPAGPVAPAAPAAPGTPETPEPKA